MIHQEVKRYIIITKLIISDTSIITFLISYLFHNKIQAKLQKFIAYINLSSIFLRTEFENLLIQTFGEYFCFSEYIPNIGNIYNIPNI